MTAKRTPSDLRRPYTSPTPGYKKIPKGQSFRTEPTNLNPLVYSSTQKPGVTAPAMKEGKHCGASNNKNYTVCFHCGEYFDE